ncbi:glycosyltransferase [Bacillus cereus]
MKYIPNGIEIDSFRRDITIGKAKRIELGISNQFVWLAVGRVESEKDYPNLIMAFNELIKSNGNCVLVIVGEGSKLDEIKELAIELGVDEKIKFLGKRSDIKDLMSMSDSFVLSSIYEGLPMVLLEASVCELPLIATDVGGNREVINDGENGYLVSKSNPMELAGKMLQIMNLGVEERLNMGNKARKYVEEKYRIEKVLDEWEKLYYENI